MTSDPYDLERFVAAQDARGTYASAVSELRAGRKVTHWMWFVFPQIAGLGMSEMSRRYAISSLEEARRYLAHPILGERLSGVRTDSHRAGRQDGGRRLRSPRRDEAAVVDDAVRPRRSRRPALPRGHRPLFRRGRGRRDRGASARLEVDPHHDPADGRPPTSVNPAAAKMLRLPTWSSPQVTSLPGLVIIG